MAAIVSAPVTVSRSLRPWWRTSATRKHGSSRPPKPAARPPDALGDRADPPAIRACRGAGCGPPRRSGSSAARPPRSSGSRPRGSFRSRHYLCGGMTESLVYTTEPARSAAAKALLDTRGIPYDEINLAKDPDGRAELVELDRDDDLPAGHRRRRAARRLPGARGRRSLPAAWPRCQRRRLSPRPRLAALADVGPAPGRAQLAHRPAAHQARLALAQVDEEAVLEGALDAVGVAEVVDRRALRASPPRATRLTASRSAATWRRVSRWPGAADGSARGTAPRRRRCSPRPRPCAGRAGTPSPARGSRA